MSKYHIILVGLVILPSLSFKPIGELRFRKQMIAAESNESVGVFDVNGDQQLDIVSGSRDQGSGR